MRKSRPGYISTGQGSPGQRCILMNFQRKYTLKTVYRENIDCTETDWISCYEWFIIPLTLFNLEGGCRLCRDGLNILL